MFFRRAVVTVLCFFLGTILFGCRSHVSKEKMAEAAAYSKAMCACKEKSGADAKACADAIIKPADVDTLKHTPESYKAYDEVIAIGTKCMMEVFAQ